MDGLAQAHLGTKVSAVRLSAETVANVVAMGGGTHGNISQRAARIGDPDCSGGGSGVAQPAAVKAPTCWARGILQPAADASKEEDDELPQKTNAACKEVLATRTKGNPDGSTHIARNGAPAPNSGSGVVQSAAVKSRRLSAKTNIPQRCLTEPMKKQTASDDGSSVAQPMKVVMQL